MTPYLSPVARLGAASLLVLPIVWQNEVVGTVVLGFADAVILTDEERGRARNLGDRVGVAFATAAKDEQLYFQANYDPLTALPNRLYFMDQLARRLAQTQREPRQFACSSSISTTSSSSTTRSATKPATTCCGRSAERLRQCVRETERWRGSAATSSPSCFRDIKSARRLGVRRPAHHRVDGARRSSSPARNSI